MLRRRALVLALLAASCSGGTSQDAPADGDVDAPADASALDAGDDADAAQASDAADDGAEVSLFPSDDGGTDYPLPPIPSACKEATIFAYAPNGYATLLGALEADSTACGDYYVHVASSPTDRTQPRGGGAPNAIRARTGRFFAVAEFSWSAWAANTSMTWLEKGVEFRKRMDAAGYEVARGDTWAVVELPATLRSDANLRANVRDLLHGLQSGPVGATPRQGFVMLPSPPQGTIVFGLYTYKQQYEGFLADANFWSALSATTLGFGQEAYLDATKTCVAGAAIASLSDHVNAYAEHPVRLETVGPASTANAKTAFAATYLPVLNAAYMSTTYATSSLPLAQMLGFVSLQVYATRAFADASLAPGARIGLLWDEAPSGASAQDLSTLAARVAAALHGAYDPGAAAVKACSSTGATTSCTCTAPGAAFNEAWATFATW